MNREAVRQGKPMVECAVYELEAQVTTIVPGQTPCLACLCPEPPADWRRQFPVFGAVAGMVGCLGAMEVIKLLTRLGEPLRNRMLTCDLRTMSFRQVKTTRRLDCPVCGTGALPSAATMRVIVAVLRTGGKELSSPRLRRSPPARITCVASSPWSGAAGDLALRRTGARRAALSSARTFSSSPFKRAVSSRTAPNSCERRRNSSWETTWWARMRQRLLLVRAQLARDFVNHAQSPQGIAVGRDERRAGVEADLRLGRHEGIVWRNARPGLRPAR